MSDRIAWAILALAVVASYAWTWHRLDGARPLDAYGPLSADGHVTAD